MLFQSYNFTGQASQDSAKDIGPLAEYVATVGWKIASKEQVDSMPQFSKPSTSEAESTTQQSQKSPQHKPAERPLHASFYGSAVIKLMKIISEYFYIYILFLVSLFGSYLLCEFL